MATAITVFEITTSNDGTNWNAIGYNITGVGVTVAASLADWSAKVKTARDGLQGEPDAFLTPDGQQLRDTVI